MLILSKALQPRIKVRSSDYAIGLTHVLFANNDEANFSSLKQAIGGAHQELQTALNVQGLKDYASLTALLTRGVSRTNQTERAFMQGALPLSNASTEPLSPEALVAGLKTHYTDEQFSQLQRETGTDHSYASLLRESFINLVLVKHSEQVKKEEKMRSEPEENKDNKQGKETLTKRDIQMSSFETIFQPKEAIELPALFDAAITATSPIEKRHLVIEGRAGIGKTTLSKYLVHQWALGDEGALAGWSTCFSGVLFLPLRAVLNYANDTISLTTFIQKECLPTEMGDKITAQQLQDALDHLEARRPILYVLDGYDEVAHQVRLQTRHTPLGRLFETLWQKPCWIITSRPKFLTAQTVGRHTHIENIGLTEENIPGFVTQYMRDTEQPSHQATQLVEHITSNPNLRAMATVPINLEWLCTLPVETLCHQNTLTDVYTQMINFRLKRQTQRTDDSPRTHYQDSLHFLGKFAWAMMTQGVVMYAPANMEIPQTPAIETALKGLGLVHPGGKEARLAHPILLFHPFNNPRIFCSLRLDQPLLQ